MKTVRFNIYNQCIANIQYKQASFFHLFKFSEQSTRCWHVTASISGSLYPIPIHNILMQKPDTPTVKNLTHKIKAKTETTAKEPSVTSKDELSHWEMMIDGIVRPPRAKYHQAQLGSKVIDYKGKRFLRDDHKLKHDGKNIELTLYLQQNRNSFIILYMHGNSSCRLEALGLIRYIPKNISLACFDFMGCGKNEQMQTISLGYREAEQTHTVVNFLINKGYRVILWGRSMGAATALLYGKAEFIVADSSFKSFKSLCKQVAKQHSPKIVPGCMINCFFPCVFSKLKKDVDRKAKYDVEDLDVKDAVRKMHPKTVVVFMSGNKDVLINSRNSQKLYGICPCEQKYIKIFEGDHNSKRPESIMQEVMQLIEEYTKKNMGNNINQIVEQEIFLKYQ